MSRIGARIVADNQRRMFDKLLNEGLGYFSDRHSSEFIARLTTGANSAAAVINLLISAVGRDLASLVGLVAVMVVQDPMLSLVSLVIAAAGAAGAAQADPAVCARWRAPSSTTPPARSRRCRKPCRASPIVKAFTLEDVMRSRLDESVERGRARSVQAGARRQPGEPADGDAWRHRAIASR